MTSATRTLKEQACAAQAEIASRVAGPQGGVPTFFDNFLNGVVTRLKSNEALHGWNVKQQALPTTHTAQVIGELQWLAKFLESKKRGRLVPYADRRKEDETGRPCDIGPLELLMSQGTATCLEWNGRPLFKTVFDFAIVPMLLSELKPATIFEIGSGTGTSARWMADLMTSFGSDTQIHSVDIKPVAEAYSGVHFRAGDCKSPASLFDSDLLRGAPHPFLVIEDAHINVHDVLMHIDGFLTKGDYLFVEDSRDKTGDLERFTSARANRYKVDTRYTDFFGRNATCAANSIFVRS
jgi:cephalosporin hydroxylase